LGPTRAWAESSDSRHRGRARRPRLDRRAIDGELRGAAPIAVAIRQHQPLMMTRAVWQQVFPTGQPEHSWVGGATVVQAWSACRPGDPPARRTPRQPCPLGRRPTHSPPSACSPSTALCCARRSVDDPPPGADLSPRAREQRRRRQDAWPHRHQRVGRQRQARTPWLSLRCDQRTDGARSPRWARQRRRWSGPARRVVQRTTSRSAVAGSRSCPTLGASADGASGR
jgi:hypothetical protein